MVEIKKFPAIRFKSDSQEWDQKTLLELSENGFTNGVFNDPTKPGGRYKLVNVLDMYIDSTIDEKRLNFVDIGDAEFAKNKVENGDVFFTRSSLVKVGIAHSNTYLGNAQDITFDGHLIRMRPKKDLINSCFLNYLLKTSHARKQLVQRGKTATMTTIGQADIAPVSVIFPKSKDEQTQIGSYFQHLDKLISLHQSKVNKLTNLKKAMLEKMFPKQGEDVPEIRFKGFAGAWKLKKFNEFAEVKRGLTYRPSDVQNEGVRVLRSSNIDEDKFVLKDNDVFVKESAINIDLVVDNDILITSANGSSRLVGKHAVVKNITHKVVHGGFMLLCRTSNAHFLNASMSASWYKRFLDVYVAGGNGAIGNLKKTSLEEQDIFLPSDDEQIKIGTYFQNLDKTITLYQTELEKLGNLKKACLEKMFV